MKSNWKYLFLFGGWLMLAALMLSIYSAVVEDIRLFSLSFGLMLLVFPICSFADKKDGKRFEK